MSSQPQLCIECFNKHNIQKKMEGKINELCGIKSNYDYEEYLNINTTLSICNIHFSSLSLNAQENLRELDEYFLTETTNNARYWGLTSPSYQSDYQNDHNHSIEFIEEYYSI